MACCFYLSLFNEYVAELLEAQTASKSRTLRVYYIHITWKQPNWFFFLNFFFLLHFIFKSCSQLSGSDRCETDSIGDREAIWGDDPSHGWGEHPLLLTWCLLCLQPPLRGADAILGYLLLILWSLLLMDWLSEAGPDFSIQLPAWCHASVITFSPVTGEVLDILRVWTCGSAKAVGPGPRRWLCSPLQLEISSLWGKKTYETVALGGLFIEASLGVSAGCQAQSR